MLRSNEKQFRGVLGIKARRLFVSPNSKPRVIKKKKKKKDEASSIFFVWEGEVHYLCGERDRY